MEEKKTVRGIDPSKQKVYIDAYAKEARLRLKWFRKNEDRLVAFTEQPNTRTVPAEVLEKLASDRKARYEGVQRHANVKFEDPPPPQPKKDVLDIMKPVDPKTTKLIYSGTQKDGRINYFHERVKIIPENRFHFPIVTSYDYGWNMWNSSKSATPVRYGRCQVVKASFYRRNGVARDPDWYQEPAVLSPTICTCT